MSLSPNAVVTDNSEEPKERAVTSTPGRDPSRPPVRELAEETGITVPATELRQVGAFDAPGRDPRGRYVTVAYTATLPEPTAPTPQDDAADARWWPLNALPPLAFDHAHILTATTR
ncbi:NUDIX domain-containing protein [Streptomyces sp. SAI-25]|uniref:NUDIX domain-containing protein n=1 Tax=Streptomyces sp. SAI-25 TaxID=1472664 RepID=UPI00403A2E84